MQYSRILIFFIVLIFAQHNFLFAQQKDSLRNTNLFALKKDTALAKDSLSKIKKGADTIGQNALKPHPIIKDTFFLFRKTHTPKGATLRSMIFPGWGQAYNHEYWKVPLAMAAVGIPIYLYFTNTAEYNRAKTAYNVVFQTLDPGEYPGATNAPLDLNKMVAKFRNYYNEVQQISPGEQGKITFLNGIQSYRNSFRQYRDYSLLFAVLLWGVQVADATVFGHLREFNVSPDLSMKISPAYFQYTRIPGIAITMNIK